MSLNVTRKIRILFSHMLNFNILKPFLLFLSYSHTSFLIEIASYLPKIYFKTILITTDSRTYVLLRTQVRTFILSFGWGPE